MSIMGEVPYSSGEIAHKGKLTIVEQEPKLFAGSIKDNILFGRPLDEELYQKVVRAARIELDLKELAKGDETEVGEKGMNLSGGQKARISFGRALYSDAQIYLMDDPFSAVDSKVLKEMFEIGVKEFLKDKTVILVTHHHHVLKDVEEVIYLEAGKITKIGGPTLFLEQTEISSDHQLQKKTPVVSSSIKDENSEFPQLIKERAPLEKVEEENRFEEESEKKVRSKK
jgi:ATP-binding cassette subfamily C (CFTR/MRP) protein 4